ncbi:MAG: DUF47 family protein [Candidatus Marinimicrobia bacterium]|nr:DUF47 family protein [Candidatus Neomarinimicrobiota bacterium]
MPILFKKTQRLENQIDDYLDMVIRGGLLFKEGVKYFLNGSRDEFEDRLRNIDTLESDADLLRREIENSLYKETLIPEERGDVLGIIENTDKMLNVSAETLMNFSVEDPFIPEQYKSQISDLCSSSVSAIDELIAAIRAYFRDVNRVRDGVNKVMFYEKEADKIADRIKRAIFQSEEFENFSRKLHLKDFIEDIENISDTAEEVCDRLSIAAIKRTI